MRRYLCGVPKKECNGAWLGITAGLGKSYPVHSTNVEAFECYKRYLLKLGYQQIGAREFVTPITGYVLVLNKKNKFGAPLRLGKSVEGGKGNRLVPKRPKSKDSLCGTIIGI